MLIHVSYPITENSPLYPGMPQVIVRQDRSIGRGDSANTHLITFSNHSGTHVDVPYHFCSDGSRVSRFLSQETVFSPAWCIDIGKNNGEEITVRDIAGRIAPARDAEALLVRTGWHRVRAEEPGRYCTDHPWVSPEIPAFLRKNCPGLRIFGLDLISVSSVLHREEGRRCHREFLCRDPPVLLLEDLDLSDRRIMSGPFRLHIYPHIISDIDGVPVTAVIEQ